MAKQSKQRVDVSDQSRHFYHAAQNINITQQYQQGNPDLFTPKLKAYRPPLYPRLRVATKLVKELKSERLLLLGGVQEIDKRSRNDQDKVFLTREDRASLARHLSCQLSDNLRPQDDLEIKEWHRGSDTRSLTAVIEQAESTTIFLLMELRPQDVHCDLHRLRQATRGRQFIISTTEVKWEDWHQDEAAKRYWEELKSDEVFDDHALISMLNKELSTRRTALPKPFNKAADPELPLVEDMGIQDIAIELGTPTNIVIFAGLLSDERHPVVKKKLIDLIETSIEISKDPTRRIHQAFHSLDGDVEKQLMTLGFTFFEGMFDDQAFAALEQIYEKVWTDRDSTLRMPDYLDLYKLNEFFSFQETERGAWFVKTLLRDQRRVLLNAAWNSRRRQILAALRELANMVAESVEQDAIFTKRELFGSEERCRRLRDAVANTLSDIGLISIDAVEDHLLFLAAHEDIRVQAVAARAMARWREFNEDEQLFDRLEEWQRQAYATNIIQGLLEGQQTNLTSQPEDFIRATIALAVGYAAQYDPKNRLSPRLFDLVETFAKDPTPLVRLQFHRHTLPQVVASHFASLKDYLRRTVKDMYGELDLMSAIAVSLAYAYQADSEAVAKLLDEWYEEAEQLPSSSDREKVEEREGLLIVIVLTDGALGYEDKASSGGASNRAVDRVKEILAKEDHLVVREAVIRAIAELAKQDFNHYAATLKRIVANAGPKEKDMFAEILVGIFLTERQQMEGGDAWVEIHGTQYRLWVDSERPFTNIEKALLRWIREEKGTVAQKIAFQCWLYFEEIFGEAEESKAQQIREERIKKQLERQQNLAKDRKAKQTQIANQPGSIPWRVRMRLRRETQKGQYRAYKETVRGLLPQALDYKKEQRKVLKGVLERWTDSGRDNTGAQQIAELLKKVLRL